MNFNDSDDNKELDISDKVLLLQSPRKVKIEQNCGYDIIQYAATMGCIESWNNPMENKIITATATSSSPSTNPISCIFDPSKKAYRTFNKPDQSIEIILPFSVIITSYQLIQKVLKSKKWVFEGWFHNNWSLIINNHPKNDDEEGVVNDGRLWKVPKKNFTGTAFKRFRIKQTARNNNHGHTLEVQQIKMYGFIYFDEFISSIPTNQWVVRKKLQKKIVNAQKDVEMYCIKKRLNLSKNEVVGIQINGDVYKGTIKKIVQSFDDKISHEKLVIKFSTIQHDQQEDEFDRNSQKIKILNPDYDPPKYGSIDINEIISHQFSDDNDNNNNKNQQQSKPRAKRSFNNKNIKRFVQYGWDEQLSSKHLTISADGCTVTNTASDGLWQCAISPAILNSGQYSFQIEIINTALTINQWKTVVGVVPLNFNVQKENDAWIGKQKSWGYIGATGGKCCDIEPFKCGECYEYGDPYYHRNVTIKCQLNFNDKTIKFSRNHEYQGTAFQNLSGAVRPAVCVIGKGAAVRIKNMGK